MAGIKRKGPKPGKKDYPVCGAKTRSRVGHCQNPAGAGTNHLGEGRCKFHGGNAPVKHGRYSKIKRPEVKQLIDEFEKDPEPLNLLPEVLLLRALLHDYVDRHDKLVQDLAAWRNSYGKGFQQAYREWYAEVMELADKGAPPEELPEPPEPLDFGGRPSNGGAADITSVAKLIDQVGTMVDRIEKHKSTSTISLATLSHLLEQVGVELVQTLQEEVRDEALRSRVLQTFERRWGTVRIQPDGSVAQRGSHSLPN